MPITVVCTICSRDKDKDEMLVAARSRYTSSHIRKVERIADENCLPFFILSGLYGLISADEPIPHYDHVLGLSMVTDLHYRIHNQLAIHDIEKIHFYTKDKPAWQLYERALGLATEHLGVELVIHQLNTED